MSSEWDTERKENEIQKNTQERNAELATFSSDSRIQDSSYSCHHQNSLETWVKMNTTTSRSRRIVISLEDDYFCWCSVRKVRLDSKAIQYDTSHKAATCMHSRDSASLISKGLLRVHTYHGCRIAPITVNKSKSRAHYDCCGTLAIVLFRLLYILETLIAWRSLDPVLQAKLVRVD